MEIVEKTSHLELFTLKLAQDIMWDRQKSGAIAEGGKLYE
jgi:hypothetical protein